LRFDAEIGLFGEVRLRSKVKYLDAETLRRVTLSEGPFTSMREYSKFLSNSCSPKIVVWKTTCVYVLIRKNSVFRRGFWVTKFVSLYVPVLSAALNKDLKIFVRIKNKVCNLIRFHLDWDNIKDESNLFW